MTAPDDHAEPVPRQRADRPTHVIETPATQKPLEALEALEPLEPSQILWDLVADVAAIGVFDWDLITGRLVWDRRLIELFGYRVDSFAQSIDAFYTRVHPDDRDRVAQELQVAIDGVGLFESEYRLVLPDDSVRWIGARGRALPADGPATRLVGAAYDITDRRAEQSRLAAILDSLPSAFCVIDRSGMFTYANDATARLLGRDRAALTGEAVGSLLRSDDDQLEKGLHDVLTLGSGLVFEAHYAAPLNGWFETRLWASEDGVVLSLQDVNMTRRLRVEAERAQRRTSLLARITEELIGTLERDTAAQTLASLVVPDLGQWCIVTLVDDTATAGTRDGLQHIAARHTDPSRQAWVEQYARHRLRQMVDDSLVIAAVETETIQRIHSDATNAILDMLGPGQARDVIAALEPESVAIFPLSGRDGPVGMLSVVNDAGRGDFTDEDMVTGVHVAARAGLVLDNARLYRQQREMAERLQRSLLVQPESSEAAQIVVRYQPAGVSAQVGGDWYDVFSAPDASLLISVGDVTGHDVTAAATMGQLRSILRGVAATTTSDPADIISGLDAAVTATNRSPITATTVLLKIETDGDVRHLRWTNAGHPPPVLVRPGQPARLLEGERSEPLIGVRLVSLRSTHDEPLQPGDLLITYTDGLIERRTEDIDDGLTRLLDLLDSLAITPRSDLDELADTLLERLRPVHLDDDIAIVLARIPGE